MTFYSDVAGAMNDAVPGSEAALPAPTPLLPSERRADKLPKPSKPAAKAAKPVEAPPAEFQTQEPYVPPPAQSKVGCLACTITYACVTASACFVCSVLCFV